MKKKLLLPVMSGCVVVALVLLSPFACSNPDGLEKVAARLGFLERERVIFHAVCPGYHFHGVENGMLATTLAGLTGAAVVFALVIGGAYLLKKTGKRT
jgi:hypothetical protein